MALRQRFGPLAQGPAAIVSRHGDEAVFATDAMGLRPLWQFETPYELVFSSERGVFSAEEFVSEPKPLAPGEKVYLRLTPEGAKVLPFDRHQRQVLERVAARTPVEGYRVHLTGPLRQAPPPLAGGSGVEVEEKPAPPPWAWSGPSAGTAGTRPTSGPGQDGERAHRLPGLRRAPRRPQSGKAQPLRVLQGDGGGGDQPRH